MQFKEILFLTDCSMTDAVFYAVLCCWSMRKGVSVTILDASDAVSLLNAEAIVLSRPEDVAIVCNSDVPEKYLTRPLRRRVYAAVSHVAGILKRFPLDPVSDSNFRRLYERLPSAFQMLVSRIGITEAGNMVASKIHSLSTETDFRNDADIAELARIRV